MRSEHNLFNMEKDVCTYAQHYNAESIEINELLELWIQVTLSIPHNQCKMRDANDNNAEHEENV